MNYLRVLLAAVAALVTFFAWGFLTEGWLLRKDFAASAALYRSLRRPCNTRRVAESPAPFWLAGRLGDSRRKAHELSDRRDIPFGLSCWGSRPPCCKRCWTTRPESSTRYHC